MTKPSELINLVKNGNCDEVINLVLKKNADQVTNADLFWCAFSAKRIGNFHSFKRIYELSRKNNENLALPNGYSDRKYISEFGFFFGASAAADIRAHSSTQDHIYTDEFIEEIEEGLLTGPIAIQKYISDQRTSYSKRVQQEYRYITEFPIEFFPYKYLSDYRSSLLAGEAAANKKISFIYCVKNRSKRTSISILSLLQAYEEYVAKSLRHNPVCDIEIIISEDKGVDPVGNFSEHRFSHKIQHFIVDTGLKWTRSGLLNFGLRHATGEIVAFCDVDFLFDYTTIEKMFSTSRVFQFNRQVLTINCIETECHVKQTTRYSKNSPYGYMWLVGREQAIAAGGFNEEYIGHGFEDRDFEYRLTKILGLEVVCSASFDLSLVIFHLSHNTRTGEEDRSSNRDRFLSKNDAEYKVNPDWGSQKLVSLTDYRPNAPKLQGTPIDSGTIDLLIMPHNSYHTWTIDLIKEHLVNAGIRFTIASPLPRYGDEGVEDYCLSNGLNFIRIDDFIASGLKPASVLVFNDWDTRVARPLVVTMAERGVHTIGLIEGINDYQDVDTGRIRSPYRTVKYVLAPGEFEVENYFADMRERAFVVGVPRIEKIVRPHNVLNNGKRHALINCNFTYGVLENHREEWLTACIKSCQESGYTFEITKHRADKGNYSGLPVSSDDFYTTLLRSSVLISRFSTCILEALSVGIMPIYFNPGFERVHKFQDSFGAYPTPTSNEQLTAVMKNMPEWNQQAISSFLQHHCATGDSSGRRIAGAILEVITSH